MDHINWDGVMQSITDFWLPTFGWILLIVIIIVLLVIFKNKHK